MGYSREDGEVTFAQDGVGEVRAVEEGDMTISFQLWSKGTDGAAFFKGLPDDACQCHHSGYLLSGRMGFRMVDGSEQVIEAGEAYHVGPGHVPVALEDCDVVEFTPTEELRRTMEHVQRQAATS